MQVRINKKETIVSKYFQSEITQPYPTRKADAQR